MKDNKVVIVHLMNLFGGGEIHSLNLKKALESQGYNVDLLVLKNSPLELECNKNGVRIHTQMDLLSYRPLLKITLLFNLLWLCWRSKDFVIQANLSEELWSAKKVAYLLGGSTVFVRHVHNHVRDKDLKGVDGIIAVSPKISDAIRVQNEKHNLGISSIKYIPPFFDQDKFLNYIPYESKNDFFKSFGVDIGDKPRFDEPIIAMVANFYPYKECKNHRVLFQAVSKLKSKVQVVLAGEGPDKEALEKYAKELGIKVHFLGFTKRISDLLYHSNIKVLPSGEEAFGIVLMEGALMKKPLITTAGQGGEMTVIDGKTGLLVKNGDADDLALKIEYILDHPDRAKEMGEAAYTHVMQNLSREVGIRNIIELYGSLKGDRTPISALRGQCPNHLDDEANNGKYKRY